MYTKEQLVLVAKRDNNKKRNYLVLNRLQGKHLPAPPGAALEMFGALAAAVERRFGVERLLVIGFAETATAIGAVLAARLDSWYLQTTREPIRDTGYFSFSELHSHAVEQTLARGGLDAIMPQVDRIVFAEDEVTTGRTILNIIAVLEQEYGAKAFAVASLLNGLDSEALAEFEEKGIALEYLVKTDHAPYTAQAERYKGDGRCVPVAFAERGYPVLETGGYVNARRLTRGAAYHDACARFAEAAKALSPAGKRSILVLGTEEFMYPAMLAAREMEKMGHDVRFHATTRSPILPSREEGYPVRIRHELQSPYDEGRRTFVYELAEYDRVFLMTDAPPEGRGLASVLGALESAGNREIQVVRWCGA